MRDIDILCLVEHVDRELDVACALKCLLQSRGCSMDIASYHFHQSAVANLAPRVVALPVSFVGLTSKQLLSWVESFPQSVFVDLAYEQLYHKINEDYRCPRDEFAKHVAYHFAWGSFNADYLARSGVAPGRIFITGNPVCALYAPPYRRYFAERSELAQSHGLDLDKTWLLVTENYKAAFLPESKMKAYARMGASPREIEEYRAFDKDSLAIVLQWLKDLARGTDVEIIVRPRPATPLNAYVSTAAEGGTLPPNLHLIKDRSAREWILASDVVMSSISTTLIEAAVAGKPVYVLAPCPIPAFLHMQWMDCVDRITTLDEMCRAAATPSQNWSRLQEWSRRHLMQQRDAIQLMSEKLLWFVQNHHTLAAPERLANLVRTAQTSASRNPEDPQKTRPTTGREPVVKTWMSRLRAWSRPEVPTSSIPKPTDLAQWYYEKDDFGPDEIERRVASWRSLLEHQR